VSSPLIGVLALQGDVREHRAMLERAGARSLAVRRPREVEQVDALVMPGGESTTMTRLARTFDLLEPVAGRLREGLPAFGTCAGMILLADRIEAGVAGQETVGGLDVVVRRNAFGRQVDSFEADLDVVGLDEPFHAVFIRAPGVEATGEGVEVLAEVDGQAVLCRQGAIMVSSFHPELTDDLRLHQMFLDSFDREVSQR
jgi:5'-phosphate synthase pdxT subunit